MCVCVCVCVYQFFFECHFRDSLVYMTLYQLLSVEVGKRLPMSPDTCVAYVSGYLRNWDLDIYFLTCAVLTGRYCLYNIAYEKPTDISV